MKRQLMRGLVALGCLAPVAAQAQAHPTQSVSVERTPTVQGTPVTTRRVIGTAEARITTDRPYSAEAVNESVQVLADGNRITRRSVTRVYRDTAGRTRLETLAEDGSVRTISISDAVARVTYTLDPATKTARQSAGNMLATTVTGTYSLSPAPEGSTTRTLQRVPAVSGGTGTGTGSGSGTGTGRVVARSGGGTGGATLARTPAPKNPNVKTEEVGTQSIEGVSATGTRTTTTIPAGQIGNAREITVLSERWFSDELQVLVLTKHSDPRSGESTYFLRNILRAEPDPSLFVVPSDYTIQSR